MNEIEKLRQRLIELQAKADDITASANAQRRKLTAEERADLDGILDEFDNAEGDLKRLERVARNSTTLDTNSRGRQTTPDTIGGGYRHGAAARSSRGFNPRERGALVQLRAMQGAGDMGPFRTSGEWLSALHRGDPAALSLVAMAGQSTDVGEDGGYAVPTAIRVNLFIAAIVSSPILSLVDSSIMVTQSERRVGPATLNHANGAVAGVLPDWYAEGAQIGTELAQLTGVTLLARKLACMLQVPNELLADAPAAGRMLEGTMADAIRAGLEKAVLAGTGIGSPLGIINAPSKIVVSKEVGQAADTVTRENVIKMLARIAPNLLPGAVWLASPSTLPQLLSLVHRVPNAANDDFVGGSSEPASLNASRGSLELFGMPVWFSEFLPTVGDQGDLVLCNPREYALGVRAGLNIAFDQSGLFDRDSTRMRATIRADGVPKWAAPLTPAVGDTLSWCVVLEAR